jgi:hypothetical protein
MAGVRRIATARTGPRAPWPALLAAMALAAGAAGAFYAEGRAGESGGPPMSGANASDLTGPAAASGWG